MTEKKKNQHVKAIGKEVRQRAWDLYKQNWGTSVSLALLTLFFELIVLVLMIIHPAFKYLSFIVGAAFIFSNILLAVMAHNGRAKVTVTDIFTELSLGEFLSFIFAMFVKFVIVGLAGISAMGLYAGYAVFAHYEVIDAALQTEGMSFLLALFVPITTSNIAFGVCLLSVFIGILLMIAFGYRYSLVEYIEADMVGSHPSICLTKSKELMEGYKTEMFGSDIILNFIYMTITIVVNIIFGLIIYFAVKIQLAEAIALILEEMPIGGEFFALIAIVEACVKIVFSNSIGIICITILCIILSILAFVYACLINMTHSEFYFILQDVEDNTYVPYKRISKISTEVKPQDNEEENIDEGIFYDEENNTEEYLPQETLETEYEPETEAIPEEQEEEEIFEI